MGRCVFPNEGVGQFSSRVPISSGHRDVYDTFVVVGTGAAHPFSRWQQEQSRAACVAVKQSVTRNASECLPSSIPCHKANPDLPHTAMRFRGLEVGGDELSIVRVAVDAKPKHLKRPTIVSTGESNYSRGVLCSNSPRSPSLRRGPSLERDPQDTPRRPRQILCRHSGVSIAVLAWLVPAVIFVAGCYCAVSLPYLHQRQCRYRSQAKTCPDRPGPAHARGSGHAMTELCARRGVAGGVE
jgi:hypothetical protein